MVSITLEDMTAIVGLLRRIEDAVSRAYDSAEGLVASYTPLQYLFRQLDLAGVLVDDVNELLRLALRHQVTEMIQVGLCS